MASINVVVPQPSISPQLPETSPSSPHLRVCEQVYILSTGRFQELLKAIQGFQNGFDTGGSPNGTCREGHPQVPSPDT